MSIRRIIFWLSVGLIIGFMSCIVVGGGCHTVRGFGQDLKVITDGYTK